MADDADPHAGWPWRDFGGASMTHGRAIAEAFYAAALHMQAGLGAIPSREYSSEWQPWRECSAAEFAAAGVGV